MKPEIHPELRTVAFLDTATGALFKILSCARSKETITVDGQELPLVRCDISSASHPFYTGQHRILDTAGRVEKFGQRFGGKTSLAGVFKKKAAPAKS